MTNQEFALSESLFIKMCEKAGIACTKRQASKFRQGYGTAYKTLKGISLSAKRR